MSPRQAAVELTAISRIDLADAVVDRIRDAILGGDLDPGSTLPSERELAAQLGVNRTTVREGLARLELLGLIDRRQGLRCRVSDYRRTGSLELLPDLARLGLRDVGASINEAIAILYRGTVALAAQRATRGQATELDELATAVEAAVEQGDVSAIVHADRAFQHAIAAAAQSVALELMTSSFYRALDHSLDIRGDVKRSTAQLLIELRDQGRALPHRRLAEAIAAGDVERASDVAARAMAATDPGTRSRPR
jgi:DNA-binding FadR family transcriptional regulator